jgi:ACS family tartrate transporter-like MFS transporter
MITWGIVTILTGFVRNATDIAICRFLLGRLRPASTPIVLYFTYWFPAKHHARAVSLFLLAWAANIIGGPFATWILTTLLVRDGWMALDFHRGRHSDHHSGRNNRVHTGRPTP